VVAEGVETEGQRDFLLDNGCILFQGYLFGRPVPVEQLLLSPESVEAALPPL
jgi:EAL domain-containing protein (putative c-di-GMP-specific phosphodiesterase class I)